MWYPAGVSGSQSWTPISNWAWRGVTEVATGYITYNQSNSFCYWPKNQYGQYYYFNIYSNWIYHDSIGASHTFPNTVVSGYTGTPCQGYTFPPYSATATANDGSGYTISVDASPSATVYPSVGSHHQRTAPDLLRLGDGHRREWEPDKRQLCVGHHNFHRYRGHDRADGFRFGYTK